MAVTGKDDRISDIHGAMSSCQCQLASVKRIMCISGTVCLESVYVFGVPGKDKV